VVDAAVRVLDEDNVTDADERMIIMLAAFCHDFGKPSTTRVIDGRVRALGHEAAGEAPTRSFLASIGCPPAIVESVVPVVVEHLKPFQLAKEGLNQASVRRLSTRVNVTRLCQVARADHWGRTTAEALSMTDSRTLAATAALTSMAKEIGVTSTAPKAILLGRHLIEMGMKPSPNFKKILDKAFEAQIEGTITDIESAKAWAANNI
jgi:tRNA nucleotidyltransferase (CCA-adding enzyme)